MGKPLRSLRLGTDELYIHSDKDVIIPEDTLLFAFGPGRFSESH